MATQGKTAVGYVKRWKTPGQYCRNCTSMKRPVACTQVTGRIWRQGQCSLWVLKPTYHSGLP